MENQHRYIKGYRELSEEEIELMNEVKTKEAEIEALIHRLQNLGSLDQRWIAIGRTDLQKGFMAVVRGIAQPGRA